MQLGTLSIRVNVHSRRCRHCFHNESERLPPLNKKLIYLDQTVGCAFCDYVENVLPLNDTTGQAACGPPRPRLP